MTQVGGWRSNRLGKPIAICHPLFMGFRVGLAIAALLILLVPACGERASDGGKPADGQVLRWALGPEDEDEKPENVLANRLGGRNRAIQGDGAFSPRPLLGFLQRVG